MTTTRELALPAPFSPAWPFLPAPGEGLRERISASDVTEFERIMDKLLGRCGRHFQDRSNLVESNLQLPRNHNG